MRLPVAASPASPRWRCRCRSPRRRSTAGRHSQPTCRRAYRSSRCHRQRRAVQSHLEQHVQLFCLWRMASWTSYSCATLCRSPSWGSRVAHHRIRGISTRCSWLKHHSFISCRVPAICCAMWASCACARTAQSAGASRAVHPRCRPGPRAAVAGPAVVLCAPTSSSSCGMRDGLEPSRRGARTRAECVVRARLAGSEAPAPSPPPEAPSVANSFRHLHVSLPRRLRMHTIFGSRFGLWPLKGGERSLCMHNSRS